MAPRSGARVSRRGIYSGSSPTLGRQTPHMQRELRFGANRDTARVNALNPERDRP